MPRRTDTYIKKKRYRRMRWRQEARHREAARRRQKKVHVAQEGWL